MYSQKKGITVIVFKPNNVLVKFVNTDECKKYVYTYVYV